MTLLHEAPTRQRFEPQHDLNAYFVRYWQKGDFAYFTDNKKCPPILGSKAHRDEAGNIWWVEYYPLTPEALQEGDYVQISTPNPRVKLNAPYTASRIMVLNFHKHLTVEDAINAAKHILRGEREKEVPQARAAVDWIDALAAFYRGGRKYRIDSETFQQVGQWNEAVLAELGLDDPERLRSELKRRAAAWIGNGGIGVDTLWRVNPLVAAEKLAAAKTRLQHRLEAILNPISGKFKRIHVALESGRHTDRLVLGNVLTEMEALVDLYQQGESCQTIEWIIASVLGDWMAKLKLLDLNPYYARGKYAVEALEKIYSRSQTEGRVNAQDVVQLACIQKGIKYDLDKGEMSYNEVSS